jgi:LysR family transcriptional activator of glutamate synthase operon
LQLRQLEYVAAIVRCKTMRKAAQELYISEATMSQQIRALEVELGFSLFERHGRTLRLSAQGEHLLPALQALLHAKRDFEQNAAEIKSSNRVSIRFGITQDIAVMFLPGIFRKFKNIYPNVRLEIYEGGTYALAEQVSNHAIDIAVFAISNLVPDEFKNLVIRPLTASEVVAVTSRHHHLAHKENISKVRLANEEIIAFSDDFISSRLLYAILGPKSDLNIVCATNDPQSALPLAQEGTGIIFLPRYVIGAQQMETRLRDLHVLNLTPDVKFPVQYVYAHSQHVRPSEHLKTLVEIIKDSFRLMASISSL